MLNLVLSFIGGAVQDDIEAIQNFIFLSYHLVLINTKLVSTDQLCKFTVESVENTL